MESVFLFALNFTWQIAALALLALGLAMVFGQLKIMNMAHGEFVMMGAYSWVLVSKMGWPSFWAVPVCIVGIGALAFGVERLLVRHLYARPFDSLLATWALSIIIRESVELGFGRQFYNVALPLQGSLNLGLVSYPAYRILVMVSVLTLFTALWLYYRNSRLGLRLRAMVENPNLAQAHGINTSRLSTAVFVLGCVFAGLAGLILAPTLSVFPSMGIDALIRSFFALIIGGLGSLEGLAIGTTLVSGMQSGLSALFSQTLGYLGVLVLAVIFVWRRPNGLYNPR